jgi:beta-lactamase class A
MTTMSPDRCQPRRWARHAPSPCRTGWWLALTLMVGVAACDAPTAPASESADEHPTQLEPRAPEPGASVLRLDGDGPGSVFFSQSAALNAAAAHARMVDLLGEVQSGGTVGFHLREIGGPTHLALNENFVFEPASSIKALTHFHAMRQVQDGAIIDDEVVTLFRAIPWFAGPSNYMAEENGTSCPDLSTLPRSSALSDILWTMMVNSDNRTTAAAREFFGEAAIDATRIALGMDNSLHQHLIGCSGPALEDPNRFTLTDAGLLYEAAATDYLDEANRTQAFNRMPQGVNALRDMMAQEADDLGLPPLALTLFRNTLAAAYKPGGYELSGRLYLSVAGWARIPFRDSVCNQDVREFVWGTFIHSADDVEEDLSISAVGRELLREQIRWALETWSDCEADLGVSEVMLPDLDDPLFVNQSFAFTVRSIVTNDGPASPVDAILRVELTGPEDCTFDDAIQETVVPDLAIGAPRTVDIGFQGTCSQPSEHTLRARATITPQLEGMRDRNASNNSAFRDESRELIAYADLGVAGFDLSELDGAQVGDLALGNTFEFTVVQALRNLGDTQLGLYHDPADARISRTLAVPEGLRGSLVVSPQELEATVVIQRQGQPDEVHADAAPGTWFSVDGPAVIAVVSQRSLPVGQAVEIAGGFALECTAPGVRALTLVGGIDAVDPHLLDPDPSDNTVEAEREVDCMVPVQLNIRPGNQFNWINPTSSEMIPVAVLTTEAGEYGLPVAFDATTIDPASTRFGTAAVLTAGGGSVAHQSFLRDSFEMDDLTRDGDVDLVLHFRIVDTGAGSDTTELLVVGRFLGTNGAWYSFVGRDGVQVQGP